MTPRLPTIVQDLVASYLAALTPVMSLIHGMYIHGSVALGAFDERFSDIDVVVVTRHPLTSIDLMRLEMIHSRFTRDVAGAYRLQTEFVPFIDLGASQPSPTPHSHFEDGHFTREGIGDLNPVTRWLLMHHGMTVMGPERFQLPILTTWDDVLNAMDFNLDGYWAAKAQLPHLFLADYWVEFAVSKLCRIVTTFEDQEIVSKLEALHRQRVRLSQPWHSLLDEALRLRSGSHKPAVFGSRSRRMTATVEFVRHVRCLPRPRSS